jgi:hypothetical protein
MEARNRVGIGSSYRPARPHRLAELIPLESIPGLPGFDVHGWIVCLGEAVDMNNGQVIRPLRHLHVTHQALQQQI